jgi:hypothetical protein
MAETDGNQWDGSLAYKQSGEVLSSTFPQEFQLLKIRDINTVCISDSCEHWISSCIIKNRILTSSQIHKLFKHSG